MQPRSRFTCSGLQPGELEVQPRVDRFDRRLRSRRPGRTYRPDSSQPLAESTLVQATVQVPLRYARVMKSSPGPFPTTLLAASSRDREQPPACVVVAFLHLSSRRIYHFPPGGADFVIGRDPTRSEMAITTSGEISGQHALVQLEGDRVLICDRGSTNGTRIHGRPERRGTVKPGDVFALGGADFVALSRPMLKQLEELTLYVGQNEHLPQLLTLPQTHHVVLVGAHHTPLEEIARAAHRAVASDASPIVCIQGSRESHTDTRILADAVNGRIYIDGRGSARRSAAPTFSKDQLEKLRDPKQLTAITVAVLRTSDVDVRLFERKPYFFKVPSISDRIRDGGLDELIDAVYVKWDVPYRANQWPADLRRRLAKYPWRRDHKQFAAVVVAVGRMWAGLDEHNAVQGLGAAQTVKDWLTDLDMGWASARAVRPG